MTSIRDVAKASGFSTSTVSRVINDQEAVDPATREKILATIEQLGYRPNLVAQGLRVGRGRLLGLVVPQGALHVFSLIIQHTVEAARVHGYDVIVVYSNDDPELEENQINELLRRNINGIIFSRVSDESRIVRKISRDVPIVVIDRAFEQENVANVVLDNQRAGYLAGRHLVELGHEQIGCITGPLKILLCRERLDGFREALAEGGIRLPARHVAEGDFQFPSGRRGFERLWGSGLRLTALWAMNDLMACGALKGLQATGLAVPRDVSLIGMDDTPFCELVTPALTTIQYPFKALAEQAVEVLLEQIKTGQMDNETRILEPGLTVRESTAHCVPRTDARPLSPSQGE